MTTTRRILVLAGTVLAVMIGTSVAASASYADSAASTTTIATDEVQPPRFVTLDDSCSTTTTTVRRTVRTDPVTGVQTQTSYSQTSSTSPATSNVQSSTTTTEPGPGVDETTTTTVTQNTNLHVTLGWTASRSPGVTGYLVSARLGIDGSAAPLLTTTATTISQVTDADMLSYQPRLFVTTQTSYRWTSDSKETVPLAC
jgi:hypothetical protein